LGPLFETAVVSEVRKQIAGLSPKPNLYRWRSHKGAEVYLSLEYNGVLFARGDQGRLSAQPLRYALPEGVTRDLPQAKDGAGTGHRPDRTSHPIIGKRLRSALGFGGLNDSFKHHNV
jgi:hypothetical protein